MALSRLAASFRARDTADALIFYAMLPPRRAASDTPTRWRDTRVQSRALKRYAAPKAADNLPAQPSR